MKRHFARLSLAIVMCLPGCRKQGSSPAKAPERPVVAAGGETDPNAYKITRTQAVETALKELRKEPVAQEIDTARMTVHFCRFGPVGKMEKAGLCWVVDFARRGSSEITRAMGTRLSGHLEPRYRRCH